MRAMKPVVKVMLVIMKLVILIIIAAHANDPIFLSSAPTPPPTNLHPFHLDDEMDEVDLSCKCDSHIKFLT
jgi:hypothetical protein